MYNDEDEILNERGTLARFTPVFEFNKKYADLARKFLDEGPNFGNYKRYVGFIAIVTAEIIAGYEGEPIGADQAERAFNIIVGRVPTRWESQIVASFIMENNRRIG